MQPDDRRLVWADQLLERGDPRGELITTQCALERGDLSREDSLRMRRREAELLAQVDVVGGLGGLAKSWTWTRGAIEEISVSLDHFERHHAEIFERAPFVHRLRLGTLPAERTAERLATILDDERIDGLELGAGADETLLIELASYLPRLRSINLFNSTLNAAIRNEGLRNLETLSLNSPSGWEARNQEPTLLHPRRLHVQILLPQRHHFDLEAVAHPDFFSFLEDLDLDFYGSLGKDVRGTSAQMAKLRRLRLPTGIAAAPLAVIANPENLTALEELTLSFRGNEEELDLGPLVSGDLFPKLRILRIGPGLATPQSIDRLFQGPLGRRLEVLDLRQNRWQLNQTPRGWDGILLT